MLVASKNPRREQPSVHRIESPLTRSGYSLLSGRTHIILLYAGIAQIADDDQISARRIVWMSDGGKELTVESGARGRILSIPQVLLLQALPTTPLGDQMRQTIGRDLSAPLEIDEKFTALIDGFSSERLSSEPGSEIAQAHYLGLILVEIWRLARTHIVMRGGAPYGLAERFVQLASQRLREHWSIEQYAHALDVNRDRLGAAVKRSTGLSPQAYLHRALIREAMELLANTGATVGQIAFRLGFVDPAYFTRFFKRQVGENPATFRKIHKVQDDEAPQSFAAWP
ncbi:helix-turn-helix domain-containing protein [Loktanella sp. S4079]|uniref:helix-turn-helix domain-containing protein n=1 Tax=Loktanella sp. S4079 TaxID=579483 RepID=UPI000B0E8199|nr:helix-turn-helix domain-containing protein [Loktanella sp. S4079]